ncbi:MAG: class I SAM-dependent methyltransferase [Eubacteriales bacterium]
MKMKNRFNVYDLFMFPLEAMVLKRLRRQLIPKAKGDVLEIGAGTGANLSYYRGEEISTLTMADKEVSRAMKKTIPIPACRCVDADILSLPFDDNHFDTVVETLVLCSVADVPAALGEIKRVLKPNGQFIHIDHGLPKKRGLKRVFKALAPLWYKMSQSCQIDKTYAPDLEKAGFTTNPEGYTKRGVFYWGISQPIDVNIEEETKEGGKRL